MTTATFHTECEQGHVDVVLGGEIDLDNAPELEVKLHGALRDGTTSVRLDLSGLTYIDSIGMRTLFLLASRLEARHIHLVVVAVAGSMARRVIELSGFGSIASLEP
jgi:anti-anti-sigma factor